MHIYTKEILKGKKKHACFQQAVSYSNINNDIPEPLEQLYLFATLLHLFVLWKSHFKKMSGFLHLQHLFFQCLKLLICLRRKQKTQTHLISNKLLHPGPAKLNLNLNPEDGGQPEKAFKERMRSDLCFRTSIWQRNGLESPKPGCQLRTCCSSGKKWQGPALRLCTR